MTLLSFPGANNFIGKRRCEQVQLETLERVRALKVATGLYVTSEGQ